MVGLGYALVLTLAVVVLGTQLARPLEFGLLDKQQALLLRYVPQPIRKDVVIVGIDEATLHQFAEPFALWHGHLGTFLRGMALAKASVVGLDVALPSHSFDSVLPGSDAKLLGGLVAARPLTPVVLGVSSDATGQPLPIHAPFVTIAGTGGTGSLLLAPDADHVVRRFNENLGVADQFVPSLAGQMLRKLNPGVFPQPGLINYTLGGYPRYIPLQQVNQWVELGDVTQLDQTFAGKPVLLGSVLPFEDRQIQPVNLASWESDNGRNVPGVLVHAQILRSLLNGGLVTQVGESWGVVLALICSLLWFLQLRGQSMIALALVFTSALLGATSLLLHLGWYLPAAIPLLVGLLSLAGRWLLTALLEMGERRRLRAAFAGYVSPPVMQAILQHRLPGGLGGELRHVCMLFADIRGFTTLSEGLAPQAVIALLNRYFEQINQAIHGAGGTISCFMGDGVMAIFGAPQNMDKPSVSAFAAARAMLEALQTLNVELQAEGRAPIAIGIGLHVGEAIVGHLGSLARHDYSAIGDAVNVASRIEGLTKELGYPVVCSQAVVDELAQPQLFTDLGLQAIKGHSSVQVWGWKHRHCDAS
jgi:adenylate cyclase